jgi:hypothetical protein
VTNAVALGVRRGVPSRQRLPSAGQEILMRLNLLSRARSLALAGIAALALAVPGAAMAVPADSGPAPQAAPPTVQLTPSQLRAINGHQPVDPPAASQSSATTFQISEPDSAMSGWLIALIAAGGLLAALAAFGGVRVATHRSFVPHRHTGVGV